MLNLLVHTRSTSRIGLMLAVAALTGWGSFAYSAVSSGQQVKALTEERDAALANYQQLQEAGGKLIEIDGKLGSARIEYNRVVQGWANARDRVEAIQQQLAALTKRLDQARDQVSQTGSIRPAPKTPARK